MSHFNFKDKTGMKFGRLTVISLAGQLKWGGYSWNCKCECGNEIVAQGGNLATGHTTSCGCWCVEKATEIGARKRTHGHSRLENRSIEYITWQSLRQRCCNPNASGYADYGGRGITVCERWEKFENFLEDMGNRPTPTYTIERLRVNGNYEPSNCVWATMKEQSRNKRNSRLITMLGATMHFYDWCDAFKINSGVLAARLRKKWPIEKALTEPIRINA